MSNEEVLLTGAAGFIGFHIAQSLLSQGREVIGVDNMNNYYDPRLKEARLAMLKQYKNFSFVRLDLADRNASKTLFEQHGSPIVIHLAAQAGVRHSLQHPHAYIDANLEGFINVLEGCRQNGCRHLLFASSSSVYGANAKLPFSVYDNVDHPISLYAASKKANELMAHAYSHLYGLPATGLRLFTVYGPWGRPDMAMFIFAKAILSSESIKLFNYGNMLRDFTFIDDVSQALTRLIDRPPKHRPTWDAQHPDPSSSSAPWKIYNIGNNRPERLMHVVELLQHQLGRKTTIEMLPLQAGDVEATYADVGDLERDIGFRPSTPIEEGIAAFARWFLAFYDA